MLRGFCLFVCVMRGEDDKVREMDFVNINDN